MERYETVIDTNVFYAGLRSQLGVPTGCSAKSAAIRRSKFIFPCRLCWSIKKSPGATPRTLGLTFQDIDDIIDYLCSVAALHKVFYLWRPFLPDPEDDMLLELAVEAGCNRIITFNVKDFVGIEQFGIEAVEPGRFLHEIGAAP